MKDKEIETFRNWLEANTNFSKKVIGDTASRLNRIEKIRPINRTSSVEDFLFQLGKEPLFNSLGPAVKSQLRRACKLYYESIERC